MRKSQKRETRFKGGVTAFLALIFVLMMSLIGALVESVSVQVAKNRKRADTLLALESTFAEYDREMLEQYDLFVRNGCSASVLQNRLEYYGAGNAEHHIQKLELLTDRDGSAFLEQAIRYAKDWLGMDVTMQDTEYRFYSDTYQEEEELVHMDMEELLAQDEQELPEEGNPISSVENLKKISLLKLVCENPEELSNRRLETEQLPSVREKKTGNWEAKETVGSADKAFLTAYLTEHFGNLTENKESRALLYELEYLVGGYSGDRENLERVCKQILSIRMVANYAYLLTDTGKKAEAEAMALTLCSLLTVPGITEVVKHALLLAWAYGESIVDVRVLLKGKKVPAVKNAENWQLQLVNLVKLGTGQEETSEYDASEGISYQTYLTGLVLMENQKNLSMRSLDLIESNLKIRTDECMTKVQIESKAVFRRGVKDTFTTSFGYQ